MYPQEDLQKRSLVFHCKFCGNEVAATDNCVYRHNLVHFTADTGKLSKYLSEDPTLPTTKRSTCPRCHQSDAVYVQQNSGQDYNATMVITYLCRNPACGYQWSESSNV